MKTLRDAGIASKKIEFGVKLLAKVRPLACDFEPCLAAYTLHPGYVVYNECIVAECLW